MIPAEAPPPHSKNCIRSAKLLWFGHRGSDCLLLAGANEAPAAAAFMFGSVDGAHIGSPQLSTAAFESTVGRMAWSSEDLEAHASEMLREIVVADATAAFPFRASEQLESWAGAHCVQVASCPAKIVAKLANRRFLTEVAAALGLPVPDTRRVYGHTSHDEIESSLGSPYVVKTDDGVSGLSCFHVSCAGDLERVRAQVGTVPITAWAFLSGPSLNFHVAVSDAQISVSNATEQTLDASDSLRPYRYRGNTFTLRDKVAGTAMRAAESAVARLGVLLRSAGFVGVAGADVIVAADGVRVVDLNPRFQGSSLLLDLNIAIAGMPRLKDLHLDAFCTCDVRAVPSTFAQLSSFPINGQRFVTMPGDHEVLSVGARPNGRYQLVNNVLSFIEPYEIGTAFESHELLVLDLPRSQTSISPGALLARVLYGEEWRERADEIDCLVRALALA